MKLNLLKILSLGLVAFGVLLILNASLPILHYEIFSSSRLQRVDLLSPIPQEIDSAKDPYPANLRQASNWFVGRPDLPTVTSKVKYYNITIPKIGVKDATVEIGGEDLSKSLIHYGGTALPGREGNAVIFGHSTLPQLFRPSNYLSVFSKLPTLKKGDLVYIDYDGIVYTFRVEEMFEVKPTDIQVLEQKYDDYYVTLITCVPPGTFLRRLVVRGKLVPPS